MRLKKEIYMYNNKVWRQITYFSIYNNFVARGSNAFDNFLSFFFFKYADHNVICIFPDFVEPDMKDLELIANRGGTVNCKSDLSVWKTMTMMLIIISKIALNFTEQ